MNKKLGFPKSIVKIMTICMVLSLFLTASSVAGYAEEPKQEIKAKAEKAFEKNNRRAEEIEVPQMQNGSENVIEVSDLETFTDAVRMVTASDETAKAEDVANPWQNKRLLVRSEEGFDTMGAIHVVQGYDSMYILTYASEEAAKAAYEGLKQIPYLMVEPDTAYYGTAKEEEVSETTMQPEEIKPESGSSNVIVAVLDTGYDINSYGDGEIVSGTDMTASGFIQDENGHGSAMANIILKNTSDHVKIMPVKVADATGQTSALKLYMGICYAIENKADIINISMSAYKASNSEIVNEAIRKAVQSGIFVVVSAGNEGEDVANYSPANLEEAVVVSAVNADKSIMEYSNYGAYVDYCAYGKVKVQGLGGKETEYSGTSVSAAIVSGVIAKTKSEHSGSTYEELTAILNEKAKDLGDAGRDLIYGVGFLSSEEELGLEDNENTEKPELLTCNWKQLSNEELDEIIWDTQDYYKRKFLDDLTQEEKEALLARDTVFTRMTTTVSYQETAEDFIEKFRVKDTLYNYLYSEKFNEYKIQYHLYHYGPDKIYLNTSLKSAKATLTIEYTDHKNEVTNEGNIIVRGESNGAIDLDNVAIGKYKDNQKFRLGSDDNGRTDIIMGIKVEDIVVTKPAHSQITDWSRVWTDNTTQGEIDWYKRFPGGYSNGTIWDYLKEGSCTATEVTEAILFGNGDFEMSLDKKPVTYTLKITQYDTTWGKWGEWKQTRASTCTTKGSLTRTREATCDNCSKKADSKTETKDTPQLAHTFVAKYAVNNGITNGQYWEECNKNCGGYDVNNEFWQRNVKYHQKISYRYMKPDGTYPNYTIYVNNYYGKGTSVPGYHYIESETSEYISAGIDGYTSQAANHIQVDVPRKQYTIQFKGDGEDSGTTPSQKVRCGQSITLNSNGFKRLGYRFLGWSKKAGGKVAYKDKEEVLNLSYTNGETVTLYAVWEAMKTIEFRDNLTDKEKEILSKEYDGTVVEKVAECPKMQWKVKGEDITIHCEEAVICNKTFGDIFRFKGWSLTPVISSDDEIILSKEKESYTFTKDEDVILYAQWDSGFTVAYIGNNQSEGMDYLDEVNAVTDSYTFYPNEKEQIEALPNKTADYFLKFIEKSTIDITSGEAEDESGNPYMEEVPYSFLGWSMYSDKEKQLENTRYLMEDGEMEGAKIILDAKKAGLTFGVPTENFGAFNAAHENRVENSMKGDLAGENEKPYVNMYAIWDEYPQIAASDLYLSIEDAKEGKITEEYLLNYAIATDEELKSSQNLKGKMKNGDDTEHKTKFTVLDYQSSDFLGAESDMAMTITYCAKDSVGNTTTKMVTVHLVDTAARSYDSGNVRFISKDYADTLSEDSIWRTGEYATLLSKVLSNEKTGETYTSVTPLQQAFGTKSVAKPGSGTWKRIEQVWEFTHEEVLAVQDYVKNHGIKDNQNGFLTAFYHCRLQ